MQDHGTDSVTISVEDAAKKLGIGRTLAYELARRGELPGVLRFGRIYRVSLPALNAVLEPPRSSRPGDAARVA